MTMALSVAAHPGVARGAEPSAAHGQPTPGGVVTIEANDPRIATENRVRDGAWCGAMWCSFTGVSVKLIGGAGPGNGMAAVYVEKGLIATGEHAGKTFMTQTMDVVPVVGKKNAFIWIGDSLGLGELAHATRAVCLPVTLKSKGEMELQWRDSWDLSVFD